MNSANKETGKGKDTPRKKSQRSEEQDNVSQIAKFTPAEPIQAMRTDVVENVGNSNGLKSGAAKADSDSSISDIIEEDSLGIDL